MGLVDRAEACKERARPEEHPNVVLVDRRSAHHRLPIVEIHNEVMFDHVGEEPLGAGRRRVPEAAEACTLFLQQGDDAAHRVVDEDRERNVGAVGRERTPPAQRPALVKGRCRSARNLKQIQAARASSAPIASEPITQGCPIANAALIPPAPQRSRLRAADLAQERLAHADHVVSTRTQGALQRSTRRVHGVVERATATSVLARTVQRRELSPKIEVALARQEAGKRVSVLQLTTRRRLLTSHSAEGRATTARDVHVQGRPRP
jgi:hypothetical protein